MQDISRSTTRWCSQVTNVSTLTKYQRNTLVLFSVVMPGQTEQLEITLTWPPTPLLQPQIFSKKRRDDGCLKFRFGFKVQTTGSCCCGLHFKHPHIKPLEVHPQLICSLCYSQASFYLFICLFILPLTGQPATYFFLIKKCYLPLNHLEPC